MFFCLDKREKLSWLPQLFDLLHENMHSVAPSGKPYEEEKAEWLAEVSPALEKPQRQIVLCVMDSVLAGFAQYYIRDQLLMIEEIQLKKEYQKTTLFYQLCKYLRFLAPADLQRVEAYADRRNLYSIHLMEKLGMQPCEEAQQSPFVHIGGTMDQIRLR